MTNHPRRIGRRKHERRAESLFARGPRPRPTWAVDPHPGRASTVRFYLATRAPGADTSPPVYWGRWA